MALKAMCSRVCAPSCTVKARMSAASFGGASLANRLTDWMKNRSPSGKVRLSAFMTAAPKGSLFNHQRGVTASRSICRSRGLIWRSAGVADFAMVLLLDFERNMEITDINVN